MSCQSGRCSLFQQHERSPSCSVKSATYSYWFSSCQFEYIQNKRISVLQSALCNSILKNQTVKKQHNLFPKPKQNTTPPPTLRLDYRRLLINPLINHLMQSRTFFPCFVILNHTLQAVTEVIVGSFKIFLGKPLSSIVPEELGGVSTTRCAPSACAHSGGAKKQELKPKSLQMAEYSLSATPGAHF